MSRHICESLKERNAHWNDSPQCDVDPKKFQLRIGPNYKKNKQKAPSAPALYEPIGLDVFRTPSKTTHIMRHILLPKLSDSQSKPIGKVPPFFVVNMLAPAYDVPSLFGAGRTDGSSYSIVAYFLLSEEARTILEDPDLRAQNPSHQLWYDFCRDDSYQDRMKFLANLCNVRDAKLPSILEKLVVQYNMKPVLSRPQHYFFRDPEETYLECDIDVHIFNYLSRKGWDVMKGMTTALQIDAAFVIEARSDEELPERLLGVIHCGHLEMECNEIDFGREPIVSQSQSDYWIHEHLPDRYSEPDEGLGSNELNEEDDDYHNDHDHGDDMQETNSNPHSILDLSSHSTSSNAWPVAKVDLTRHRSESIYQGFAPTSPSIPPVSPQIKIETTLHMPHELIGSLFSPPASNQPTRTPSIQEEDDIFYDCES